LRSPIGAQGAAEHEHARAGRRFVDRQARSRFRPAHQRRADAAPLMIGMHVPEEVYAHVRIEQVPDFHAGDDFAAGSYHDARVGPQVEAGDFPFETVVIGVEFLHAEQLPRAGVEYGDGARHVVERRRAHDITAFQCRER